MSPSPLYAAIKLRAARGPDETGKKSLYYKMKVNLAETIRKLRKAENLTQEEVAAALGVTLQAVSRWETGASLPDVELLPSIAAFFGVTLDALFGVDPESEEAKLGKFYDEVDEIEPDDEQIALIKRYMAELPGCPYLRLRLMEAHEERGREYASARLDEMQKLCRFIIERTECGDWQRDLALRIMIEVEDDNLTGEWLRSARKIRRALRAVRNAARKLYAALQQSRARGIVA